MKNMLVKVVEARYRGGHRVWLRFDDGLEGEIDLLDALRGPIFEPLKDPRLFAEFSVDLTLTWPNGADLAPNPCTSACGALAPRSPYQETAIQRGVTTPVKPQSSM